MTKRYNETGTFTVWALGLCLLLFALSGISVDLWRAYDARRSLGEVADIAARSGASEINVYQRQLYGKVVLDPSLAKSASNKSIEQNASLNNVDVTGQRITIDSNMNEVNVELESDFSFFLLKFVPGGNHSDIKVSASARPFGS